MALVITEFMKNLETSLPISIFGTDIADKAVSNAQKAIYRPESLNNIRFEFLKYFEQKGDTFTLKKHIRQLVSFSKYDLMDKKSYCPPESVFGNFDLVLCRNVLIYYDTVFQNRVFSKLYKSLNQRGYLILGETEMLTPEYQTRFKKVNECCNIFQKIE